MSIHYSRTMVISCDRCPEAKSFTCPGGGTDWKEANEHFFRLGWTLSKGKHSCPSCAKPIKPKACSICGKVDKLDYADHCKICRTW